MSNANEKLLKYFKASPPDHIKLSSLIMNEHLACPFFFSRLQFLRWLKIQDPFLKEQYNNFDTVIFSV